MHRPTLTVWAPVFLLTLILLQHPAVSGAQVITSTPAPPVVPANILGKLDPVLKAHLRDTSGRSRVIVRARSDVPIAAVTVLVSQLGGTTGRDLPIIHGEVADVPNVSMLALAANPRVEHIALDRRTRGTLERTGPTIGSTAVRQ